MNVHFANSRGSRLAPVGVLVYLAEWRFIIGFYADPPAATAAAAELAAFSDARLAETQVYAGGVAAAVLGLLVFGAGLLPRGLFPSWIHWPGFAGGLDWRMREALSPAPDRAGRSWSSYSLAVGWQWWSGC